MDMRSKAAIRGVANAIVETVRDVHPDGAPEGPMYAAFSQAGGDLRLFMGLVDALIAAGRLRRSNNQLFLTDSEADRGRS